MGMRMGCPILGFEVITPQALGVLLQAENPSTATDPQGDLSSCRAEGMLRLGISSDSSWQGEL